MSHPTGRLGSWKPPGISFLSRTTGRARRGARPRHGLRGSGAGPGMDLSCVRCGRRFGRTPGTGLDGGAGRGVVWISGRRRCLPAAWRICRGMWSISRSWRPGRWTGPGSRLRRMPRRPARRGPRAGGMILPAPRRRWAPRLAGPGPRPGPGPDGASPGAADDGARRGPWAGRAALRRLRRMTGTGTRRSSCGHGC